MAVAGFLDWHHETGDTRKHPERASPNGFWPTGCPFRRSNHIHCATPSKYHVVFIPKGRKKALYGKIRKFLGPVLRELAGQRGSTIVEGHMVHDHVHMLIRI